jgi:hypothetical protein
MEGTRKARCVNCRSEVTVPDSYAHGDHIPCGTCGTSHKVSRGEVLRLVIADATPLKEALRETQRLIDRLEDELKGARGSFGLGANGLFIGVAYVIWQVARHNESWTWGLGIEALVIAVVTGVLLETANYFFLAKRQKITRLTEELESARAEGRLLQQRIRDASRG